MRDQPFKRYFPSEKKTHKEAYKYPTYQHYYEPRRSEISPKPETPPPSDNLEAFSSPKRLGGEGKSSLKLQLEHLKSEVHRIMEKKQGILRSPIEKRLSEKQPEPPVEDSDGQSVSSEKIFGETARRIELKRATESYDYGKYVELENNLLKTELRNLKGKYLAKKRELAEKCQALEDKVAFLEAALFKSEQSLAEEVGALREALRLAHNSEKQEDVPTSDKDQGLLVEELNQKIASLTRLNEELGRKLELKQTSHFEQLVAGVKAEHEARVRAMEQHLEALAEQYRQSALKEKEELRGAKMKCEEYRALYENTEKALQETLAQHSQREADLLQASRATEQKYEQLISSLQGQLSAKLTTLSPKKERSREPELSPSSSRRQQSEVSALRGELKRWKVEYKLLKQRYEAYTRLEGEGKAELKEYYRGFREAKNKVEVITYKNKVLEQEFEKYMKLISSKDALILRKEVELRKAVNEAATERLSCSKELVELKDRCRALESRLAEETQRGDREAAYRKEIEEKLLGSPVAEEAVREGLERARRRLVEQDEKIAKSVKELKNKEALIAKLKQELRELMEGAGTREQQQGLEQAGQLVEALIKREETSLHGFSSRLEQEKAFWEEQQRKFLDELEALKLQNQGLKRQALDASNQLKTVSHAYCSRTEQLQALLVEKEREVEGLREGAREAEVAAAGQERSLREEVEIKNEEIDFLRREVVARHSQAPLPLNASFDEALRLQIEGNNRLREESLKKAEEIYKLRDHFTTLRSQHDNLKSEHDIAKLKFLSEKNNLEVAFQAEAQNYRNAIDNCEKKALSLEQKIQILIEENKKKDQFIQNFIIGKRLPQNEKDLLADFMKQYEIAVASNDLVQRLTTETNTIAQLEKNNAALLREVAALREKLVLLQSMDADKVSLYESIVSRKSHRSIEQEPEEVREFEGQARLKKTISMQDFTAIESEL